MDPKTTTTQEDVQHFQQHNTNAGRILAPQHGDIFGPQEYGKYKWVNGRAYRATTALVMADETGQKHIMAQSIYGSSFGSSPENKNVEFTSRSFGAPPSHPGIAITRVPNAPMTAAPPPMNPDFLTPPAHKRSAVMKDELPPPARRYSTATTTSASLSTTGTRGRANTH